MHGRGVENWRRVRRRLMCTTRTVVAAGDRVIADFFFKDGRKISVGECALFKPPQDSPPFIGIIRCLKSKEENPQLGVNWLYRPADVKLGKGVVLGAAPNEIFYSFHTDEIPAASLLHPCKVAFLPKGVELPPGTSSFICRRVYDIANKCLWWLTDPDYIDERLEEVNQLLSKTQKEMHGTLQSGSPKPVNGPTSTSQVKTSSDNLQNCAPSFPSQNKRKKREHADHGMESVKRERSLKADDSDSNQFKADNLLKSEIASITEKGGLVDCEGVEKLVKLMQPDRAEKKMDLASRSMLVGAIAVTDKFDCLTQFLQLRGLPVLDEWLQDIHKGKIDAGKDGDKAVEEFLLVLLRALDKLPVNLQALQMCNIGRSVNHLRTNKNVEIQKKARSLVDTWKKRVEAEMNIIETKSGSSQAVPWPSKSRVPDVSHGGSRHGGGSSEISRKNSGALLPTSKSSSPKPLLGETAIKSASSSPEPMKTALSPGAGKDGQTRNAVASDLPSTPIREEKSSSSSQSHTYSQSFSGKEDARSSAAGSMSVNKISSGTSRHRKSVNGGTGPVVSGVQRETGSSKTTSLSASTSERLSGLTCEKALDVPAVEGKNHKLIVKIPNRGRSPALSTSGGLSEDPSMMNSRASSPLPSEKHDQFDRNIKEKSDARRTNVTSEVNTESWQSNNFKEVLTGSDEGDVSPAALHNEDQSRNEDDVRRPAEVSKAASSPWNELSSDKKYKGSNPCTTAVQASSSARDDFGMNLLASVAAGEMPKSNAVSPSDSPGDPASIMKGNQQVDSCGGTDNDKKLVVFDGSLQCKDRLIPSAHSLVDLSSGRKNTSCSSKEAPAAVDKEHSNSFNVDPRPTADKCLETSEKAEMRDSASVAVSPFCNEMVSEHQDGKTAVTPLQDHQRIGDDSLLHEDKGNTVLASKEGENQADEVHSSQSLRKEAQKNTIVTEECNDRLHSEKKPLSTGTKSMNMERADDALLHSCSSTKDLGSENPEGLEIKKAEELGNRSSIVKACGERSVQDTNDPMVTEGMVWTAQKNTHLEVEVDSKEAQVEHSGESVSHKESPASHSNNREHRPRIEEGTGEHACRTANASLSHEGVETVDARPAFDLNEGLTTEEGKLGKSSNLSVPDCTSSMHVMNPLPFPVTSVSSCLPASITVAAPAKGPFVPIQDLLRSKGELGWKGSAATSAFRPAEPRKVLEMPLVSSGVSLPGATGNKNERPMLDFDLNVPGDRILEDNMDSHDLAIEAGAISGVKSSSDLARNEKTGSVHGPTAGRLELDLNSVVETTEIGHYPSTSGSSRLDSPLLQVKSVSPVGFLKGEFQRGFDLNNGPVLDDDTSEPLSFNQHTRAGLQPRIAIGNIRMNSPEIGNFSSWYPSANTYSTITVPSVFHDAGNKPFPIISPQKMSVPSSAGTLNPDVYRGPVLSSSPAVHYAPASFQYPVFPFGTSFPLAPATFSGGSTPFMDSSSSGRYNLPVVNPQLLGPAAADPSHVQRPYMVGLPDRSSKSGMESSRKWSRQGLDLNAGPGGVDMDGRDETMLLASRQFPVASSQALVEEQARMHHLSVSSLKRKEPDGSWETESFRYKQSPWQ